ncbi:MAG: ribonuclease R family protein [Cyanobacteria bacterium P01_E01_bin.6]
MEKGTLVEIQVQGDRRLAVIDRPEGKKNFVAVDGYGRSHTIHPRQMSYQLSGKQFHSSDIEAFLEAVKPYLDPSSLEVAWEFLSEDECSATPQSLAELLFSESTPHACYAAHCLLSSDKIFFKRKGDHYEPRPAAQISDIKHQLAAEEERKQQWQSFLASLADALEGKPVQWQEGDRHYFDSLERFAVQGDDAPGQSAAHDVLSAFNRPKTPQAAFHLLVDLRIWDAHENLFLKQRQIPIRFPQKVLDMADGLLNNSPPDYDVNRLDLTHLKVCTIDDESTCEIDDGLSLEFLGSGKRRVWVHIADPTRWLQPGDALDLDARRRASTVYLPTGMIPMFPPALATGPMSLIQGQVCCALSFGIVLDDDGRIEDYSIHPSLIRPTYRLTYEDVDEILELGVAAEPELEAIAALATRRKTWRRSQGAVSIHMPESSIKVCDDEITIDVLDDSKSRELVAEMMILAGEVAGHYGSAHDLPLPFRGQTQPELPPDDELLALPAGPVRYCAIRRCMPRSEMNTTPMRHAGLGLDLYTQVTSPIRRYTDLLCHFQIKAHLRGDTPPFDEDTLQRMVQAATSTAYEATLVERQTKRYWGLEFLRRHDGQIWQGLMLRWLRQHENLGLVLIEDLGLELPIHLSRPVELGDRLDLKVTHADPRQDVIRFIELVEQAT